MRSYVIPHIISIYVILKCLFCQFHTTTNNFQSRTTNIATLAQPICKQNENNLDITQLIIPFNLNQDKYLNHPPFIILNKMINPKLNTQNRNIKVQQNSTLIMSNNRDLNSYCQNFNDCYTCQSTQSNLNNIACTWSNNNCIFYSNFDYSQDQSNLFYLKYNICKNVVKLTILC